MENENQVSIPPYKEEKVNIAAMNQELPSGSTWKSYSATVYGKFNSFREAHIQLTNFERTGKFDHSLEPLGRGHRIRAAPNRFTLNESSSEDDSVLTQRKELDSTKESNFLRKPPKEPAVFTSSGKKSQSAMKTSKALNESQPKQQKKVFRKVSRIELPTRKEAIAPISEIESSNSQTEYGFLTQDGSGTKELSNNIIVDSQQKRTKKGMPPRKAVCPISEIGSSCSRPQYHGSTKEKNGKINTNHTNKGQCSLVSTIEETVPIPTSPITSINDGTLSTSDQHEMSSFDQSPLTPTAGLKNILDENDNTVPWDTQYWNGNTHREIAVIPQMAGQSQSNQPSHDKNSFRKNSRPNGITQQALPWYGNFSKETCHQPKNILKNKGCRARSYMEEMDSDAQIIPNVGISNDHSDNAQENENKRKKTHNTIANMSDNTHQTLKKTDSGRSHSLVLLKNQERILKLLESQNELLESPSTVVISSNLKDRLPVKTMEEFKTLNKSLRDEEKSKEFIQFIRQIGAGRKASEATRFVWKQLVKDSCARHFNWLGMPRKDVRVPKKGMSKQRITSLVLDGLRLNQGLQSLTLKDFADYTKDWLRHAPKRDDNAIRRESASGQYDSDSDDSEDLQFLPTLC